MTYAGLQSTFGAEIRAGIAWRMERKRLFLRNLGFSCSRPWEKPLWRIYLERDRISTRRCCDRCIRWCDWDISRHLDDVVSHGVVGRAGR